MRKKLLLLVYFPPTNTAFVEQDQIQYNYTVNWNKRLVGTELEK